MSDDHAADIDRHVRNYLLVFGALMILTGLTVAAWYFLDLSVPATITVALLIATVKASLVAGVFMHLISEKKLIYSVLLLTATFFLVLVLVPLFTSISDQVTS